MLRLAILVGVFQTINQWAWLTLVMMADDGDEVENVSALLDELEIREKGDRDQSDKTGSTGTEDEANEAAVVSDQSPPPERVLDELTVEGVVKHIKKLQASDNSEMRYLLQLPTH